MCCQVTFEWPRIGKHSPCKAVPTNPASLFKIWSLESTHAQSLAFIFWQIVKIAANIVHFILKCKKESCILVVCIFAPIEILQVKNYFKDTPYREEFSIAINNKIKYKCNIFKNYFFPQNCYLTTLERWQRISKSYVDI